MQILLDYFCGMLGIMSFIVFNFTVLKMSFCDEFIDFCQLYMEAQYRFAREALAGSRAEVYGNDVSVKKFCDDETDFDYMWYLTQFYAIPHAREMPSQHRDLVMRIISESPLHKGYVRLQWENDQTDLIHSDL